METRNVLSNHKEVLYSRALRNTFGQCQLESVVQRNSYAILKIKRTKGKQKDQ